MCHDREATLDGADLKCIIFRKLFKNIFVDICFTHSREVFEQSDSLIRLRHPLKAMYVRKPTRFSFFYLFIFFYLDHLILSNFFIINNSEFDCSHCSCACLLWNSDAIKQKKIRFSFVRLWHFACCPLCSNGSFGMQLGNLLSVFHIIWHVYDPNKFKDVNFSISHINLSSQ